jgi:hypothetical protein
LYIFKIQKAVFKKQIYAFKQKLKLL